MCFIANFSMNKCKLDLDNVCDDNNVVSDWRFVVKLNIMSAL